MTSKYVKEVVLQNRPESMKVRKDRVLEIVAQLDYTLVPCRREEQLFLYPVSSFVPEMHNDEGFRFLNGDEVAIWWDGFVEGDKVTFTPYIPGGRTPGGVELPEDLLSAIFAEVGAKPIEVRIDPPFVHMPAPLWVEACEWQLVSDQLPLSEARARAKAFVAQLEALGLLSD